MTLTRRIEMAHTLWEQTKQDQYLNEYLALSDLAEIVRRRTPGYVQALEDGLSIVLRGEGL